MSCRWRECRAGRHTQEQQTPVQGILFDILNPCIIRVPSRFVVLLNADHQANAVGIDHTMLADEGVEPLAYLLAEVSDRSTRPSRSMTVRAASPAAQQTGFPPKVVPCSPGIHSAIRSGSQPSQRKSTASGLTEDNNIRLDAETFNPQPATASAEARLYLVSNDQDAMAVRQRL